MSNKETSKTYTGQCQCGHIQYSLTWKPQAPHLCYCHMCQRMAGAPVVAWVSLPLNSLKYTSEARPKMYRSCEKTQKAFCSECGSYLFVVDDGEDSVCMITNCLDQKNEKEFSPEFESYKESAPPWLNIPDIKK